MSSYFRHMYEFEKFKLTLIIVTVGLIILVIGGLVWWLVVGAPTWNTFAQNFVAYFSNIGKDIYLSVADFQTYFVNKWFDLASIFILFGGLFIIFYALAKLKKKKKTKYTVLVAGIILTVFSSATLIGSVATQTGILNNPYNGNASSGVTLTHKYILVQFDGFFRGGSWLDDSTLEVSSVTVTKQTATGMQNELRHQRTTQVWTVEEANPTAIVKVFIQIKYKDGSVFPETELWQGSYAANSQFDWTLRIDCPTDKEPSAFTLKITALDYTFVFHHGYTVRYLNTWTFS